MTAVAADRAVHLTVRGIAQGVGFRPHVYRLADRLGIRGWVRNRDGAVEVLAEGAEADIDSFLQSFAAQAPPGASILSVDVSEEKDLAVAGFRILPSEVTEEGVASVTLDAGACDVCLREIADPTNRRFRFPFTTCATCGPRATIIEAVPFDRIRTSMRAFPLCPDCREEYEDPGARRFHAETISCPTCGPTLTWWPGKRGQPTSAFEAIVAAADFLKQGRIVALRGVGGFHLAVDATSGQAVRRLRDRKSRPEKPLAVMVASIREAEELAVLSDEDRHALQSPACPIVLCDSQPETEIAVEVTPGLRQVGLMLAYTPLHRLLLQEAGRPLVMTSGNRPGCPIAISNEESRRDLHDIADGWLLHDREILLRNDDSVVRHAGVGRVVLRGGRGFAPYRIPLPVPADLPLVAFGAQQKHTFCLANGADAFVSPHIGDLDGVEQMEAVEAGLRHLTGLLRIHPEIVVYDQHPGYLSTRMALATRAERHLGVQHHHAHIAAVMAEHNLVDRVLGVALDGTGYGADGQIWGGELLLADLTGFQRVGHLRYVPLAGGDAAVREPWRVALAYSLACPGNESAFAGAWEGIASTDVDLVRQQIRARINAPMTSSMGRLFDAAAAILGVRSRCSYEAQAAMELEAIAGRQRSPRKFELPITEEGGTFVLDPRPLLVHLGREVQRGAERAELAALAHDSIADGIVRLTEIGVEETGVETLVLAGGVFQNARLLDTVVRGLRQRLLDPRFPQALGPHDGAISVGQAAIAAAMIRANLLPPPPGVF